MDYQEPRRPNIEWYSHEQEREVADGYGRMTLKAKAAWLTALYVVWGLGGAGGTYLLASAGWGWWMLGVAIVLVTLGAIYWATYITVLERLERKYGVRESKTKLIDPPPLRGGSKKVASAQTPPRPDKAPPPPLTREQEGGQVEEVYKSAVVAKGQGVLRANTLIAKAVNGKWYAPIGEDDGRTYTGQSAYLRQDVDTGATE